MNLQNPCAWIGKSGARHETSRCEFFNTTVIAEAPHPESEESSDYTYDSAAVYRKSFALIREFARNFGFKGDFTQACRDVFPLKAPLSPEIWVEAAYEVFIQQKDKYWDTHGVCDYQDPYPDYP